MKAKTIYEAWSEKRRAVDVDEQFAAEVLARIEGATAGQRRPGLFLPGWFLATAACAVAALNAVLHWLSAFAPLLALAEKAH